MPKAAITHLLRITLILSKHVGNNLLAHRKKKGDYQAVVRSHASGRGPFPVNTSFSLLQEPDSAAIFYFEVDDKTRSPCLFEKSLGCYQGLHRGKQAYLSTLEQQQLPPAHHRISPLPPSLCCITRKDSEFSEASRGERPRTKIVIGDV